MLLADVLRAEAAGEDLGEDELGINVYAQREDGARYKLGSVSMAMVYQDTEGARHAINKIKFWVGNLSPHQS